MTTESRFGWPLPDDNDPLADGAAAIRMLAGGVSTTIAAHHAVQAGATVIGSGGVTIVFPHPFTAPPVVVATVRRGSPPFTASDDLLVSVRAGALTATQVVLDAFRASTGSQANGLQVMWVAVGNPTSTATVPAAPLPGPLDTDPPA